MARRIDATVQIEAPIAVVYERISAFEDYPEFVPGLIAVHRLSPRRLRMMAEIGGSAHDIPVRVTEQRRNRSMAIALEQQVKAVAHAAIRAAGEDTTELAASVEYELDPLRERLLGLLFDPQPALEAGLRRFRDWVHYGQTSQAPTRARRSAAG